MKSNIIKSFTNKFNLSYSQLSPSDVDFKIMDSKGKIISYAQVEYQEDLSKPFVIKAERMVRLFNKRLNGVVIFGNKKEAYYGKIEGLNGEVSSSKSFSSFSELVISYENKDKFVNF
jgi:hypothetical protein